MATLDRSGDGSPGPDLTSLPPLEPVEGPDAVEVDLERTRRANLDGCGALSRTPPGALVRVEQILFDIPRARCESLGIHADTVLRCMAWLPEAVLLKLPDGDTVSLDMGVADFVSVRSEGPGLGGLASDPAEPAR